MGFWYHLDYCLTTVEPNDLTKCQGTGEIGSLYRGFIMVLFYTLHYYWAEKYCLLYWGLHYIEVWQIEFPLYQLVKYSHLVISMTCYRLQWIYGLNNISYSHFLIWEPLCNTIQSCNFLFRKSKKASAEKKSQGLQHYYTHIEENLPEGKSKTGKTG